MSEWGIPFDHIEEHWTERQWLMMLDRLVDRHNTKRKTRPTAPKANAGGQMDLGQFMASEGIG